MHLTIGVIHYRGELKTEFRKTNQKLGARRHYNTVRMNTTEHEAVELKQKE